MTLVRQSDNHAHGPEKRQESADSTVARRGPICVLILLENRKLVQQVCVRLPRERAV